MRQTLILLTLLGPLLSCNNTDTTRATSDKTQQLSDTATTKSDRQILIEELKQLQTVFASNDKEKIADLFSFPLSNQSVGIYIEDSTFNAHLDKNGNKVTRPMFIRFFREIAESLKIVQLNQLFNKLNVDRLSHMDTLQHEAIIRSEPCYHYYSVTMEKSLLTLTVGTNSNEDYKSKADSEDEIPENSSELCEHVLWWVFRFDGKKLHFTNISGAG